MTRLDALDDDALDSDEDLGTVSAWPSLPALRRSAARVAGLTARPVDAVPVGAPDRLRRPPVDVRRLALGLVTVPRGALRCDACSELYAERLGVLSTRCPSCRVQRPS